MESKREESVSPSLTDDNPCPICLNSLNEEIGSPESCQHQFCLLCIQEWSKQTNTCPIDRHQFDVIVIRNERNGPIVLSVAVSELCLKLEANADEEELVQEDEEEEQTGCEVCGATDREDTMLLCDHCDNGYHMECLQPPLVTVPIHEWFCPECAVSETKADVVGPTAGIVQRAIPRTEAAERVRARLERKEERKGKKVSRKGSRRRRGRGRRRRKGGRRKSSARTTGPSASLTVQPFSASAVGGGSTQLYLFGNSMQLPDYTEEGSDDEQQQEGPISRNAIRFNRPVRRLQHQSPVQSDSEERASVAAERTPKKECVTASNLLDSIIEDQNLTLAPSEHIRVCRDGSLEARHSLTKYRAKIERHTRNTSADRPREGSSIQQCEPTSTTDVQSSSPNTQEMSTEDEKVGEEAKVPVVAVTVADTNQTVVVGRERKSRWDPAPYFPPQSLAQAPPQPLAPMPAQTLRDVTFALPFAQDFRTMPPPPPPPPSVPLQRPSGQQQQQLLVEQHLAQLNSILSQKQSQLNVPQLFPGPLMEPWPLPGPSSMGHSQHNMVMGRPPTDLFSQSALFQTDFLNQQHQLLHPAALFQLQNRPFPLQNLQPNLLPHQPLSTFFLPQFPVSGHQQTLLRQIQPGTRDELCQLGRPPHTLSSNVFTLRPPPPIITSKVATTTNTISQSDLLVPSQPIASSPALPQPSEVLMKAAAEEEEEVNVPEELMRMVNQFAELKRRQEQEKTARESPVDCALVKSVQFEDASSDDDDLELGSALKDMETKISMAEKLHTRQHSKFNRYMEATSTTGEDGEAAAGADGNKRDKMLAKFNYQVRVEEEVKLALRPYYGKKAITKDEYKMVMRKTVPKICKKKAQINPSKINKFVEVYVQKVIGARKRTKK